VIDDELQFNRFRLDNKGNNALSWKFFHFIIVFSGLFSILFFQCRPSRPQSRVPGQSSVACNLLFYFIVIITACDVHFIFITSWDSFHAYVTSCMGEHLMSCIGIGKCFHSCSICCFCFCFCLAAAFVARVNVAFVPNWAESLGFTFFLCGAGPAPTTRLIGNA